MTREQLEAEALSLPHPERVQLAQRLIASLGADAALEMAWYDEAERRLAALEAGLLPEVSVHEVLAELGLPPLR
jgi:putative addiction module component (TIGR02574 family)